MAESVKPNLVERLKRLRQIRYDAPTACGEVEKLIPRHTLEEVIAALEGLGPASGSGQAEPGLPAANHDALQDLLRRVEGATGADRELDRAIECALFGGEPMPRDPDRVRRMDGHGYGYTQAFACHTATIDNALALVERVLPGRVSRLDIYPHETVASLEAPFKPGIWCAADVTQATAPTAPLALLAALLKALPTPTSQEAGHE